MSTLTETAEAVQEPVQQSEPAQEQAPATNDWRSSLPEDIREDPSLQPLQDVNALAKSYVHSQKMLGADKVVVPGKYATPDEWRSFYHKVGLPQEVNDYEVTSANTDVDEEFFKDYKEASHKAGVLPSQAQEMFNWYLDKANAEVQRQEVEEEQSIENSLKTLQTDWGNAYEVKLNAARNAVNHFGDDGLKDYLDSSGLGNNPNLIKVFSKIGETLSDDSFKGDSNPGNYGRTPEQAQAEINEIMADPKHPYFDKQHPNHKKALEDMQRLFTYKG
tara:strand:- start:796 stop:1620 length:825 start_codon:yes stop_codon:yes gene_type:complete